MEWKEIIIALIGLVGGGGLTALLLLPQKKRQAELENDFKVTQQWRELFERTEKDAQSKSQYIGELHKDNNNLRDEINDLTTRNAELKLLKCDKIECTVRKPPFGKIDKKDEKGNKAQGLA